MRFYEIRKGDGNQGTFYLKTLACKDIDKAINHVRRNVTSELKPYWRRQLEEEGDDQSYSLCIYPTKTWSAFGSCPYVVDIIHISREDATYNISRYGR